MRFLPLAAVPVLLMVSAMPARAGEVVKKCDSIDQVVAEVAFDDSPACFGARLNTAPFTPDLTLSNSCEASCDVIPTDSELWGGPTTFAPGEADTIRMLGVPYEATIDCDVSVGEAAGNLRVDSEVRNQGGDCGPLGFGCSSAAAGGQLGWAAFAWLLGWGVTTRRAQAGVWRERGRDD